MSVITYGIAASIVLLVAYFDITERRAPDVLTLGGLILMLVVSVFEGRAAVVSALVGAAIGLSVLFLARTWTRQGLGLGDVKFGAFLGAALGPRLIFLGYFVSAVIALTYFGYCRMKRSLDQDARIPFAPFLGAGAVVACIIGALVPGFVA